MRWPRSGARVHRLNARHRELAQQICERDPVASVLAHVHVETMGMRLSAMLGIDDAETRHTHALAWAGANLVPVGTTPEDWEPLARYLTSRPQESSSIVGPAGEVLPLWDLVAPEWTPARDVRASQPSLVAGEVQIEPDPAVRPARLHDAPMIVPAAVAMFTEEVGYDPTTHGPSYVSRVYDLASNGMTFLRTGIGPDGEERVEFKADVGALAGGVAQIQGVWTAPDLRGHGIGAAGMAAVVNLARKHFAPTVSLYVNSYNEAALATYAKVGFRKVGEFATILM